MTWRKKAIQMYRDRPADEKTPWHSWARRLSAEYGTDLTADAVRGVCKRAGRGESLSGVVKSVVEPPARSETKDGFSREKLLSLLAKPAAKADLCRVFSCSERVINAHIDDLRESGYDILIDDDSISLNKSSFTDINNVIRQKWSGQRKIKFGLVSDTHLASKSQQMTHLNTMYDIFTDQEIKDIYHAGDMFDGEDIYKGHKYEVFLVGADAQMNYGIKHYPRRNGITTHFITGNHDLVYYEKMGRDIGKGMAAERPDTNYLGQYFARVWITPKCCLQMEHPLGKPSYAVSYKTQRKIDNMRGGDKPNILAEGHYHYHINFCRRNVHAFCVPSFQGPTNLSRRLGLESDNGAFIVELEVDETGDVKNLTQTFYPFYVFIPDDY